MNKTKHIINRILSIILIISVMILNIPVNQLFATDGTSHEDTLVTVDIIVTGADGEEETSNVLFTANGDNTVIKTEQHKEEIVCEDESDTQTSTEVDESIAVEESTSIEDISTESTSTENTSTEDVSTEETSSEEVSSEEASLEQISSSVETKYTNRYTLTIDKVEEDLIITVTAPSDLQFSSERHYETYTASIQYDGAESYNVQLVQYADLSNNELIFNNGTYSREDIMFAGANDYIIRLPYEVNCEIVDVDENSDNKPVIGKYENNDWRLQYYKPGTYKVKITSVSDSQQFSDTYFQLIINNQLNFRYEDNKNFANKTVTITRDQENRSLVGTVKKIISSEGETFNLNLSGLYTSGVAYSLNEGASSTIDEKTGVISIKACETMTVTATCNLTGAKASYQLEIEAAEGNMTLFEDENGDGQKGENERVVSDTNEPIKLDAMDMIGKTIKVVPPEEQSRLYNITYSSGNNDVATASNDGTVTIKGVGTVDITVIAESQVFWKRDKKLTYKIEVLESKVTASLTNTETGSELTSDDIITLYDTEDGRSDITIDAATGGETLTLPLGIHLYNKYNDKEISLSDDSINVILQSEDLDLDFEGFIITNHEEIVRNEQFEVKITISDTKGRFETVTASVKVLLEGNRTNLKDDEGNDYYSVEGLQTGLDGETLWNVTGVVKVQGNTIGEGTEDEHIYEVGDGPFLENVSKIYEILCTYPEPYNKEHKIFVQLRDRTFDATRLFFGVDLSAPTCDTSTGITYTGSNINDTSYGIFSNDSVTITVTANDPEGNLYDAVFMAGAKIIKTVPVVKGNDGNGTFQVTLDKDSYTGFNDNLTVVIRDIAGHESDSYELKDVIIESVGSESFINLSSDNDGDMFVLKEKTYASEDVLIDVSVTDLVGTTDENTVSGLASYEVYINGEKNENLSKVFTDRTSKVVSDSFVLNTADYAKDSQGRITVEVKNIYDIVGNAGIEASFTIYIDYDAPTATFAGVETSGKENITSYGNFYNADTTFTFNVSDNMTGIKSATLIVDDREFTGMFDENQVSFTLPMGVSGQVSLMLVDNVNHVNYVSEETLPNLNDIENEQGTKVFMSDYVLIENVVVKEPAYTVRQADKGNWYKSQADLDIAITDESFTMVSSGLSSVKIYINEKEYLTKTYDDRDTIKDAFKVSINNQWIEDVINNQGSYTVKLIAMDNAGNESTYSNTVYIDTVAPVISDLTGVVDGSVNTGTVTVNVELEEKHFAERGNSTTVQVTKTIDGQTTTYEADKFTYTSAKTLKPYTFREDGTYEVVVTSEDAAGNKAVEKRTSFVIDNTAPLADILGVTENRYYLGDTDVTVRVIESNFENANIDISITKELNGEITVINSRTFNKTQKTSSLTQTFADEGTYTIKVDAVDEAGNVALTRTVIFTIDTMAPTVEITGVEDGAAYKDTVIPVISVNDNYYRDYTVSLVKTGVYFTDDKTDVNNVKNIDVTETFIKSLTSVEDGANGTFDTFDKVQGNDGIYTLIVSARDYAGRETTKTLTFSVNRFGSVYTFDHNLMSIMDSYNTVVTDDLKITEYNADRLVADSINVRITRDGSPLDNVVVEKTEATTTNALGESGWYQYDYVISKDNFKHDGVYVITVSSTDEAGNNSENIIYDELNVRFSVDTTKPEVAKVTGLSEDSYNKENIVVNYEVFDAIGLKEVKVFLNGNNIQTITEFADVTSYTGSFNIKESSEKQHVRFAVTDMAGNVVDSDSNEDINLGKVVNFQNNVTVSTDMFVRWRANEPLFYGSIIAAVAVIIVAGGSVFFMLRRKNQKQK